jgi:hypothetical protein
MNCLPKIEAECDILPTLVRDPGWAVEEGAPS